MFRRFDDVIRYILPEQSLIIKLLKQRLSAFKTLPLAWQKLAEEASGLSYADISKVCEDAIKDAIIHDCEKVNYEELSKLLAERKTFLNK